MLKIQIADYETFERNIELKSMMFDQNNKIIVNECLLSHSKNGIEIPEMNKLILLTCDNKAQVPTGQNNAEGEPITLGDFDMVKNRLENGDSMKIVFTDLINYVDSIGTINAKANYQFPPKIETEI